jgi:hypothetical protein
MADVSVSVMADRTPITVVTVRPRTVGPSEDTDIFSRVKGSYKISEDATTQEQIFYVVYEQQG